MALVNRMERTGDTLIPESFPALVLLKGAEVWIDAQDKILGAAEALWANSVKRRREAVEAASQSLQKMCECRNPMELVQTQQDWLCDLVRWTGSDISAFAGDSAILLKQMTARFEQPAGNADDMIRKPGSAQPEPRSGQPMERAAAE